MTKVIHIIVDHQNTILFKPVQKENKIEIPGISPLSGQPTLTNPLSQESLLQGKVTPAQSVSETHNTVTASDRSPTTISSADVVEQGNEAQETGNEAREKGFTPENPGGTIDFTA